MKQVKIALFLLPVLGCKKGVEQTPVEQRYDFKINWIILSASRPWAATDTSGNYITNYQFSQIAMKTDSAQYYVSRGTFSECFDCSNTYCYRLRYLSKEALLDTTVVANPVDSCQCDQFISYKINPSLRGKPLFEVYNLVTKKIYNLMYADSDMIISTSYGLKAPDKKQMMDAYNYFIFKQPDTLKYNEFL
ncbi:hypothetical protein SAMN05444410_10175 [Hydrobacter penzbergensis]|uniref:Uncharacterized protein n=1 Tax=Hydrobacter penzbergensis TaxID=1235997 RepID=A0A8X8IC81_9BACT|nr:hypothetical protein [Hydrobacter penzbergensis]SDW03491.1 hypothetical protein SAMN05444410_10175 [Hydrobacter penzbergensis]